MLKPSELTPATTELMSRLLRETFPEDKISVVTGGPQVGAMFSALPFDHLVFTGSTKVGRMVMQEAGRNLVPVTLELGGKSPSIVAPDADISRAAKSIAGGKLANAGQTCIAPDYVLLPAERLETFIAAYSAAVARLYPLGLRDDNYSSIINAQHHQRLEALVEDARKRGARIVEAGSSAMNGQAKQKFTPLLIVNATDEMAVMQEEIFGPILPIITYRTIDDAIHYVNRRPRPLALYYFGGDGETRQKVLARTTSGDVTINDTLLHYAQDDLPFGGVGASGIGAYHGIEGFRSLSHAKGIFEQGRWNLTGYMRPPYGRVTKRVLQLLLR